MAQSSSPTNLPSSPHPLNAVVDPLLFFCHQHDGAAEGGRRAQGNAKLAGFNCCGFPPPLPSKIKPETGRCNGRLTLPFALCGCQCVWDAPQGMSLLGSSLWCNGGYSHPVQAAWLPVRVGHATPCYHPSRKERGSKPRGSIAQRRCCCNSGRPPPPWCSRGEGMRRGARPKA
jgi:hypothetical protein